MRLGQLLLFMTCISVQTICDSTNIQNGYMFHFKSNKTVLPGSDLKRSTTSRTIPLPSQKDINSLFDRTDSNLKESRLSYHMYTNRERIPHSNNNSKWNSREIHRNVSVNNLHKSYTFPDEHETILSRHKRDRQMPNPKRKAQNKNYIPTSIHHSNNRHNNDGNIDLWIIGLFPMSGLWPGGLGQLPAVEMGIADVNADPTMLPGYTLRMTLNNTMVSFFFTALLIITFFS